MPNPRADAESDDAELNAKPEWHNRSAYCDSCASCDYCA